MQPPLAARSCATFESAAHRENEKTEEQLYLLVHLGHDAPLLVVNHVDDHGQAIQAILPQRLPPRTTSRPPLYPPIIKLSARNKTRTRPRSYAPHLISVSNPFFLTAFEIMTCWVGECAVQTSSTNFTSISVFSSATRDSLSITAAKLPRNEQSKNWRARSDYDNYVCGGCAERGGRPPIYRRRGQSLHDPDTRTARVRLMEGIVNRR